jgi:hypothetical protein
MECKHENFKSLARVGRITDGDDGPVIRYTVDLTIVCTDCNTPFEFIGMPAGSSNNAPMTNVDFTEARLPIRPYTNSVATKLSYQFAPDAPNTELKN